MLIIIAIVVAALIVIAAIAAIIVYRVRQRRNKEIAYGLRPESFMSGGLPPMITENEYYSETASSATPTDIYFDAMKQIPLHRAPDAFMNYSDFGDDDSFAMGPAYPVAHTSTLKKIQPHSMPGTMLKPGLHEVDGAIVQYPQSAAYPGPFFIQQPPHY